MRKHLSITKQSALKSNAPGHQSDNTQHTPMPIRTYALEKGQLQRATIVKQTFSIV